MTRHPELIGEYEPLPEPGTWRCLACNADADDLGFRASAGVVCDRAKHTGWHNKQLLARLTI